MRDHRRRFMLATAITGIALMLLPAGTASADHPASVASDTSTTALAPPTPSTTFLLEATGVNHCAEYLAEGVVHWNHNGAVSIEGSAVYDLPLADPVCEDAEIDPEFVRFTAFIDGVPAIHRDEPYQAETPNEFALRMPEMSVEEFLVDQVEIAACASEGDTVQCSDTVMLEHPGPFCEYEFKVEPNGGSSFLATVTASAPTAVGQSWYILLGGLSWHGAVPQDGRFSITLHGIGTPPDPSEVLVAVGPHLCVAA